MNIPAQDPPEVIAAIESVQLYWQEMTQQWPWMRQQSLLPVYSMTEETLIGLLRAVPAMVHSNDLRWYARRYNDMPQIYVLPPESFQQETRKYLSGANTRSIEGKQVVTLLYLAQQSGTYLPAKTLLISNLQDAPMFRMQLAHELLHCACATDYEDGILRAGMRQIHWKTGVPLQRNGNLNDLIIDTLLIDWLPANTDSTRSTLLDGEQGPYWQIVEALCAKIPRDTITNALFGSDADRLVLAGYLNEIFEQGDAAHWIDQCIADRNWTALAATVGISLT